MFLCYNKALAQWLRESLSPEASQSIDVYNFHDLANVACRKAGIPFNVPADRNEQNQFWKNECAELLMQAASSVAELKYDAIVVDEGQDFREDWWIPIEELNHDGEQGSLYVFYDPAQTLFTEKEAIPDMQLGGRLPTNCRNTRAIAETCGNIIDTEIKMHPESPAGVPTQFSVEADDKKRIKIIADQLKDLLQNEGLDSSQIAILSPKRQQHTILASVDTVGGLAISDDPRRWRNNQSILMTTVRAFKGLEADVVILLLEGPTKPDSVFTNADFYVATSRAKHVLHVVSKRDVETLGHEIPERSVA